MKKFFLGLALISAGFAYSVDWNPAFNLDVGSLTSSLNALDGNHVITAKYLDGGKLVHFRKVSQNGGNTWSSSLRISDSLQFYNVVNTKGKNALIVFPTTNSTNTVMQATYSEDCGKTWSTPQNISSSFNGNASYPETVWDGENVVSIWSIGFGNNQLVQAAWSSNHGKNWSFSYQCISNGSWRTISLHCSPRTECCCDLAKK